MLELCGVASLPLAVGVYLPMSTSARMFVGGRVRYFVDKLRGAKESEGEFAPGVLLSSGYIAGAAITGVLLAIVALPAGGAYLRLLDVPGQLQEHLPGALARFLSLVVGDESASPG